MNTQGIACIQRFSQTTFLSDIRFQSLLIPLKVPMVIRGQRTTCGLGERMLFPLSRLSQSVFARIGEL